MVIKRLLSFSRSKLARVSICGNESINETYQLGRFTKQVNWFGVHEVFDPSNRGRHLNPC